MECEEAGTSEPAAGGSEEFLPGFPTFEDYSKALVTKVMAATKSANGLPQEGDDFDYYISFSGYQTFCSKMAGRIDRMVSKIIRHQQLPCHWRVEEGGVASERTQLDDKFETIIEANDILLERASVMLDEAAGLRKNIDQPMVVGGVQEGTAEVASWNYKRDAVRKQVGRFKFIHSRNVPRPQVRFQDHVDNGNNPFVPRIKEKLNARVPLPHVYEKLGNATSLSALIANAKEWAGSEERFTHPYQFELDNLDLQPEQLEIKEPQQPSSNEDTPLTYVDTLAQLEELKEELRNEKEFAIDLEHHSYRSFLGFTCLMQISTRCHDYIIDTLELRHHMHILLDPFTNPAIVKVMHGADSDIVWLQRDFSLYIVNLFDTGQASRALNLPKFSLSFLLQYCCGVQADKQYQLADWRIRPLPSEMLGYARDDTHYLLYIYDRMRNELIRRGDHLLQMVYKQSKNVCLRMYKKPIFSETDYLQLYFKHKGRFNSQQLHCLQLLYSWRDHLAREEDESPGYILPNHMLFQIAEILPREPGGVLACCNPIPILLRQQQQEVFLLVQKARETPLTKNLPSLRPEPGEGHSEDRTLSAQDVALSGQESKAKESTKAEVKITGPPVMEAKPVITLFKTVPAPPLPQAVADKLKEVRKSLPNILNQFLEAKEMTPGEVLIQQQLAYEALAASSRAKDMSLLDKPVLPVSQEEEVSSSDLNVPKKKKLSVREMGQTESPVEGVKKPRLSRSGPDGDFSPFQYQGADYRHYTQGGGGSVDVYDPHCSNELGKSSHASVPRSRVKQKSAERSQTFAPHNKRRRQPSWPRK